MSLPWRVSLTWGRIVLSQSAVADLVSPRLLINMASELNDDIEPVRHCAVLGDEHFANPFPAHCCPSH